MAATILIFNLVTDHWITVIARYQKMLVIIRLSVLVTPRMIVNRYKWRFGFFLNLVFIVTLTLSSQTLYMLRTNTFSPHKVSKQRTWYIHREGRHSSIECIDVQQTQTEYK